MPDYVAKVHTDDGQPNELIDMLADYRASSVTSTDVRVSDAAEASALADQVALLRDASGLTDRVTYHVCQHSEGVGSCTPEER